MSGYDDFLNGTRWTEDEMIKWIKDLPHNRYECVMILMRKFTEPKFRHHALCEYRKMCEKMDYEDAVEMEKKLAEAKKDLERKRRRLRELEEEAEEAESRQGGGILGIMMEIARGWAEGDILYDIHSGRGIKVRLDDD